MLAGIPEKRFTQTGFGAITTSPPTLGRDWEAIAAPE